MSRPPLLLIRKEQIEAFDRDRLRRFEARLCTLLPQHWPDACRALGEDGLRALVHDGVERARAYGIASEPGVTRFLNVMLALGAGFDSDPRYPWAAEILGRRGVPEDLRIRQLAEWTKKALG
jgi:hypothetical protein